MNDPTRGVYLNNRFYNFNSGSPRHTVELKNSVKEAQRGRVASVQGGSMMDFNIELKLETTYNVYEGVNSIGSTTWQGTSRMGDLVDYMGAPGTSMPIPYVAPWGATYGVVPVGRLDFQPHNDTPPDSGYEWSVTVSLAGVTVY